MRTSISSLLLITTTTLAPSIALAQAPICDPGGPYAGQVGDPVQFDGTRSAALPPHMIIRYEWQFGDGGMGTGPTPTHVYAAPGRYNITLTVIDDENLQSACATEAAIATPTPVETTTWGRIKAIYRE